MKRPVKFLSVVLIISMVLSLFCSCSNSGNSNSEPSDLGNRPPREYDIAFYNYKPEMQAFFKDICNYYENETGVKVHLLEASQDKTNIENIREYLSSSDKPNIFTIQGISELKELEKDNIVLNFNKAKGEDFKEFANEIPDDLRLTSDNYSNYGIPYDIEGYGYLTDKKMLADLFALDDTSAILSDIKECYYEEFESLVLAIDNYIKNGTVTTVSLNGNKYTFSKNKTNLTNKLESVFSVAGADSWTYSDHMANIALCACFDSQSAAEKTSQVDNLKGIFSKYAQALDLKTALSKTGRNENMISESNDYKSAISDFSNSRSVFIKQGNWAYNDISLNNPELAKRVTILPVKLPLTESDILSRDISLEKLNNSIPIYVPMYYSINLNCSDLELKLSEDFLIWLNTSDYTNEKMIEGFNMIPSNISTYYQLNNNLNNDILSYKKSGNYISSPYLGAPYLWKESLGKELKEKYLVKSIWSEEDYNAIADFCISEWSRLKK